MYRIIFFVHPGQQLKCAENYVYWNQTGKHKRKFIRNTGYYIEKQGCAYRCSQGDLLFWGEWEPQSCITPIQVTDNRLLPNAIHKPFIVPNERGRNSLNTDPFVFGETFYYSNCRQFYDYSRQHKQGYPSLRQLDYQDIILFGTTYKNKKYEFALDTVFVVANYITASYYSSCYKYLSNIYPEVFKLATLDILKNLYKHRPDMKLYEGLMYDLSGNNQKGPFCFFPCKLYDKNNYSFARPLLCKNNINIDPPTQGIKIIQYRNYNDFLSKWDAIVNNVLKQEYFLGIRSDMPKKLL